VAGGRTTPRGRNCPLIKVRLGVLEAKERPGEKRAPGWLPVAMWGGEGAGGQYRRAARRGGQSMGGPEPWVRVRRKACSVWVPSRIRLEVLGTRTPRLRRRHAAATRRSAVLWIARCWRRHYCI
jgi:hypothetical protein